MASEIRTLQKLNKKHQPHDLAGAKQYYTSYATHAEGYASFPVMLFSRSEKSIQKFHRKTTGIEFTDYMFTHGEKGIGNVATIS